VAETDNALLPVSAPDDRISAVLGALGLEICNTVGRRSPLRDMDATN